MSFKNKSNISIVRDYLAGVRPITQVGYTGKKYIKRKIGERWTDAKGIEWEQKESGPSRFNRVAELIRETIGLQKCNKCGADVKWGSKHDRLFFRKTGLCEECLINYETKLRILGIYGDYETYKMASNELGATVDLKSKIKETIKYFMAGDTDVTMLCNSEGFTERWKTPNTEEIITNAKKDLEETDRRIDALIKIRDECKEKYINATIKYGLEPLCQLDQLLTKS
jgi:hypothetical protein